MESIGCTCCLVGLEETFLAAAVVKFRVEITFCQRRDWDTILRVI
jgi:hypothetical protein